MKDRILQLRSEGKTYKEIAEIVGLSLMTVCYHCNPKSKERINKARTAGRRAFVASLKKEAGGKCSVCSYSRSLNSLHFHHKDSLGKIDNVSDLPNQAAMKREVKKCVLICANCHGELHDTEIGASRGSCNLTKFG